jgi:hypothetical protein
MKSRGGVFFLQLLYLAVLGALAGMYFNNVLIHRTTLGTLPIAVPWWGAVGAVTLSLTGVFDNRRTWLPSYAYWHWARPFVGVVLSSFAVLAFQAGVLAVGKDLKPAPGVTNSQNLLYYVVAFIVGYREETARNLIQRVADVIIGPGESTAPTTPSSPIPPAINKLTPNSGPAGTAVTATGTGMSQVDGLKVANAEVDFKTLSDTELSFTVPGNGGGTVPVIMVLKDGTTLSSEFTYS